MSDGVIPPFMSEEWRVMRAHLRLAAAHAIAAAESSTTEDVAKNMGAASIALIDADFLRRQIQRREAERGRNQEPVDDDRG